MRRALPPLEPSASNPLLPAVGLDGLLEAALLRLPERAFEQLLRPQVSVNADGTIETDDPVVLKMLEELDRL